MQYHQILLNTIQYHPIWYNTLYTRSPPQVRAIKLCIDEKGPQIWAVFSADVFPEAFPILISYFYWWRCGTWNSLEVSHLLVPNLEVVQIQLQAFAKPHNFKPHIFQLEMVQSNNAKKPSRTLPFLELCKTLLPTVSHFYSEIFEELPSSVAMNLISGLDLGWNWEKLGENWMKLTPGVKFNLVVHHSKS